MDYAEFYYNQVIGYYPFDTDDNRRQTEKTIQYLFDAGVSEEDVLRFIEESPPKDCLTPDDLPDWLWEGSLLERDTFYYHHTLHIKPKAPIFDQNTQKEKTDKFYLEMKIKYTMDDLIDYFYEVLKIDKDLCDYKKDGGSFNYLLNKYKKITFCEPIDFVLALIDSHKPENNQHFSVQNVLDIQEKEAEVYDMMKRKTLEASLHKANRIIWR